MTIRHQMGGGWQTTGGYEGCTQEVTEGVYKGGEGPWKKFEEKGEGWIYAWGSCSWVYKTANIFSS